MHFKLVTVILCLFLIACSSKKDSSAKESNLSKDTSMTLSQTNKSAGIQSIKEMENFVGKKPSEVQLFEKFDLNKRIEKVLGADFAEFKSDWNNETVIMKDGEILYFTGCKTVSCAENKYFMMIDLIENNFNIINIRNSRPRSFEEGAVIGMSDKLAGDFEKTRNSAGL